MLFFISANYFFGWLKFKPMWFEGFFFFVCFLIFQIHWCGLLLLSWQQPLRAASSLSLCLAPSLPFLLFSPFSLQLVPTFSRSRFLLLFCSFWPASVSLDLALQGRHWPVLDCCSRPPVWTKGGLCYNANNAKHIGRHTEPFQLR